ncbi:MAG TPA: hypothetical protein VIH42_07365 [Thermoguttaceae bacterium]
MPKSVTSAADEMLASGEAEQNRTAWLEIIDRKLIDWGRSPGLIDEDGIVSPSIKSVAEAIELVHTMTNNGCPAPMRVVCNADGGIVFEKQEGQFFETIEVYEDGSKEYCLFANSRLQHRIAL